MEPLWAQCLTVLEDGSIAPLRSSLNRLYEAKLDTGFRNMPDYATLLVRRSLEWKNILQETIDLSYNGGMTILTLLLELNTKTVVN